MTTTTTTDVRWFSSLNKDKEAYSLENYYTHDVLKTKFIVCQNYYALKLRKVCRRFSAWNSFVFFYRWYDTLPDDEKKSFFEVVLGDKPQKPHFDIDIALTAMTTHQQAEEILTHLIEKIISAAATKNVLLSRNDIYIYTSHNEEKFSAHVIINRWCHANNEEARAFSHHVISTLPSTWDPKWIDPNVYGPTQQFRLLFSTKYGKNRHKILASKHVQDEEDDINEDDDDEKMIQFEESLLTFTSKCKIFPSFLDDEKKKKNKCDANANATNFSSDDEEVHQAMDILQSKYPDAFEVRNVTGSLVFLQRLLPTYCEVCKNIHEHENPYMRLAVDSNNSMVNIYFYCRRCIDKKENYYIGSFENKKNIGQVKKEEQQQQQQEEDEKYDHNTYEDDNSDNSDDDDDNKNNLLIQQKSEHLASLKNNKSLATIRAELAMKGIKL